MGNLLSREDRVNDEILTFPEKHRFWASTETGEELQLTTRDSVVRVDDSSYTSLVILPPVMEAAGHEVQISVSSGSNDCTVTDFGGSSYNDSLDWTDLVLSADEDSVTLKSMGTHWTIVENKATG